MCSFFSNRGESIAREEAKMFSQLILHPTDYSESSEHAFRLAISLARDHGAEVLVLHVAHYPAMAYGGMVAPDTAQDDQEQRQALNHYIRMMEPGVKTSSRLEEGSSPAELIISVAEETKCVL